MLRSPCCLRYLVEMVCKWIHGRSHNRPAEGVEQSVHILGGDPDAAIRDTYQHLLFLVLARSDHQFARPIRDRLHGFNAIHRQVDDHLLQLDPISQDRGKSGCQLDWQQYLMADQLTLHQRFRRRRLATEPTRFDRGGFGASDQSIYADVALRRLSKIHLSSRLNSILTAATPSSATPSDFSKSHRVIFGRARCLYSAPVKILAHPTRFERVTFAFGGQRPKRCRNVSAIQDHLSQRTQALLQLTEPAIYTSQPGPPGLRKSAGPGESFGSLA